MIARLLCLIYKHKRGKLVSETATHKIFACPRCKHRTSYKKKEAKV